mgnify:CR=1 FL=1|tara:strand:- start:781 stop:1068 length:288 start_codon:yes stop_codon:yes gene_type:complete
MKGRIEVTMSDLEDPQEFIRKLILSLEAAKLTGVRKAGGEWVYTATLLRRPLEDPRLPALLIDKAEIGCLEIVLAGNEGVRHSEKFWSDYDCEEL